MYNINPTDSFNQLSAKTEVFRHQLSQTLAWLSLALAQLKLVHAFLLNGLHPQEDTERLSNSPYFDSLWLLIRPHLSYVTFSCFNFTNFQNWNLFKTRGSIPSFFRCKIRFQQSLFCADSLLFCYFICGLWFLSTYLKIPFSYCLLYFRKE